MEDFKINKKGVLDSYNGNEKVIVIPDGVKKIGAYAFIANKNITSVEVPSSVTQIADGAFSGCANLEKFLAADSKIKAIGEGTFADCEKLKVIELPKTVKDVDIKAFTGCKALADDDGLLVYNGVLISYLGNGTEVVINDSVHSIAEEAFKWNEKVEKIVISDGVESIGERAFAGCINLKEINIPSSVKVISDNAFAQCVKLADQNGCLILNDRLYGFYGTQTEAVLPEGIKTIEPWAFNGCREMVSVIIPDSVTEIGNNAFFQCGQLATVTLSGNLTKLGNAAFGGCCSLTGIVLPKTLTSLGARAFYGCEKITEIIIPDSVSSIGENVFLSCTGLSNIVLPEGLEELGDGAFNSCKNLCAIHIPSKVESIGSNTFSSCNSLKSLEVPEHLRKDIEHCYLNFDVTYYEATDDAGNMSDIADDEEMNLNVIRIKCQSDEINGICSLLEESLARFYLEGSGLDSSVFEKVLSEVKENDDYCKLTIKGSIIYAEIEDGIAVSEMLSMKLLNKNSYQNCFGSIAVVGEAILKKYPEADFSVIYQMQDTSETTERVWTENGEILSEFLE